MEMDEGGGRVGAPVRGGNDFEGHGLLGGLLEVPRMVWPRKLLGLPLQLHPTAVIYQYLTKLPREK